MSKKVLTFLLVLGGLALVGVVAVVVIATAMLQPINASDEQVQQFVVGKGQGTNAIGQNLVEAGLIRHPLLFRYVVWQKGLAGKIQAGSFDLSPSMSTAEIARSLTQGTEDVWITIPEGWRTEEIAAMVERQNLPLFDADEFIALAKPSEGYLFPDTYLIPRQITAQQLYEVLTNTFSRKIEQGLASELAASEHSLEEIVVMASLVEREAQSERDMQHVAGILWHRIELDWPLQVDATLQYATTRQAKNGEWWTPPTAADKQIASPYNTYQNLGLPPAPISNPGLNAIKAAAQPLETENLFYLHDRQGVMHYATTLEEHNQNVERYLR